MVSLGRLWLAMALAAAWVVVSAAPASAAQNPGGRQAVEAGAEALGGLARVRAVRNITLIGYGQYAYMFGGGNITGDADAPQKYQAANDLRRVYDLEHDRFQQTERRNFLFPFAATFGHNYAPVNLVLDGDIAYDVAADGPRRVQRWGYSPLQMDGVHMRRMWMLNNPVAAVRAALDPGTSLSAPRVEGAATVVDLTLKQGDRLSIGFSRSDRRPLWVRWSNPQPNLGQVTFTTHFTGYTPQSGLQLPLGYKTTLDWRNIDYFKVYVDAYVVDGQIADLAAPAAVAAAPEPIQTPAKITAFPVAKGIWRLSGGTTVIEFKDHLTLFELGNGAEMAQAVIDFAKTLVPGKKPTQLIVSHHHFDHTAGFRVAVAEGLTVIGKRGNGGILREMANHAAPDFPDALAKAVKAKPGDPLKFIPVDEHLKLSDETMTADVYWSGGNTHMADAVFAYVPASKVMIEGDMATAAYDYQFWADNFMEVIDRYKLDVAIVSPVHGVSREHPDVLTFDQTIELIKGGVQRARERCAAELAKGNYFPGCPVQTTRY